MRAGGEILAQKSVPRTNQESYLARGFPLVDYSWLGEAFFAGVFQQAGGWGLIFVKGALLTATLWLFFFPAAYLPLFSSTFLLYWLVFSLLIGGHIRPQLLGFFFFALLFRLLREKETFIPFLFLLWVNGHPSFVAGLVLLALFALGFKERRRKRLVLLGLSLALTLVNPYGWHLLLRLMETFGESSFKQHVAEWRPPYATPLLLLLYLPFLFFLPLLFRERKWQGWGIALPFFLLSLSSFRFYPYAVMALAGALGSSEEPRFLQSTEKLCPKGEERNLLFLYPLHAAWVLSLWVAFPRSYVITYSTYSYPYDAVRWMKKREIQGNVFSPMGWGEYLTTMLGPKVKVAFDGRLNTAYPRKLLRRLFLWQSGELPFSPPTGTDYLLLRRGTALEKKWAKEHGYLYRDRTAVLLPVSGRVAFERRVDRSFPEKQVGFEVSQ